MSGNTQPTNTEGQPATQPQTQDTNKPSPVEQRINELVGKFHEVKGQLDTVQGMNQQLMERNTALEAEMARVRAQPAAPELPPLPDGTDSALVNAIAARVQAPLMQTISRLEQQLTASVGATSAQTEQLALQAAMAGEPQAVQQKVWDLYKEAKTKGYGGWTPQNLTWMARGMLGAAAAPVAPTAPAQFGGGAPVPNPVVQSTLPPAKTEQELKAMTSDQRIAYYESRVGDGEILY